MNDQATESAIAATAQKVSFSASGAALYGGLTANDLAALIGVTVAIIGLLVQWHYKRKADRREQVLHEAQLANISYRPRVPYEDNGA